MRLSSMENGISVFLMTGCGPTAWRIRSSRYIVISSAPVGISCLLISRIWCAIRLAIGTPRVRMPTSARSPMPPAPAATSGSVACRSRISWAMRASERFTRAASMTTGMCTSLRSHWSALKSRKLTADYIISAARSRRQRDRSREPRLQLGIDLLRVIQPDLEVPPMRGCALTLVDARALDVRVRLQRENERVPARRDPGKCAVTAQMNRRLLGLDAHASAAAGRCHDAIVDSPDNGRTVREMLLDGRHGCTYRGSIRQNCPS